MPNTTNFGLTTPSAGSTDNVPGDMAVLSGQIDTILSKNRKAVQAFTATGSISVTAGSVVTFTGASGQTLTVPAGTSGQVYEIANTATVAAVTIARSGSDTFNGATSFSLPAGFTARLNYVAANTWVISLHSSIGAFEAGDLKWSARATPSAGWLLCDGSAVVRATYPALFAAIGTTYGAGDGTTTFNLPPASGRTLIAAGTGSGLTARTRGAQVGEEKHKLTDTESALPAHAHTGSSVTATGSWVHSHSASETAAGSHSHSLGTSASLYPEYFTLIGRAAGSSNFYAPANLNGGATSTDGSHTHAITVNGTDLNHTHGLTIASSSAALAANAHENMQPSLVGNLFIKI